MGSGWPVCMRTDTTALLLSSALWTKWSSAVNLHAITQLYTLFRYRSWYWDYTFIILYILYLIARTEFHQLGGQMGYANAFHLKSKFYRERPRFLHPQEIVPAPLAFISNLLHKSRVYTFEQWLLVSLVTKINKKN